LVGEPSETSQVQGWFFLFCASLVSIDCSSHMLRSKETHLRL